MTFSKAAIERNLHNALRDHEIACKDDFKEVRFTYAYTTLVKIGIAVLSVHQMRVRSVMGHHAKLISKMAELLENETIEVIGNVMRMKRNKDLYTGGSQITDKECKEYLEFVTDVVKHAKKYIKDHSE